MAANHKPRKRATPLAFDAISIEGGLLSADWLARVAQLQAEHQSEADYRILKGLNLRDEIGRYWRIAEAQWAEFLSGQTSKADPRALAERFVIALLRDCFGFASLMPTDPILLSERPFPIGHHALGGRVPVVVAAAGSDLDSPAPMFGDGSRRRSAFGLAQEYLNAADGAVWGLASDGMTLRIVRDNASLTRPAWIEADLARIFSEQRYADFAALWLLAHETRFGNPEQPGTDCALEAWRNAGREEGTRARAHLRHGVEEALLALGQGFLLHPENQALRATLQEGALTKIAYFQQLLRLVYRLIFLLTVEERNVLHPPSASDAVRALYTGGYSLRRLRDRAVKRSAHDRFGDLWEGLKIVLRGVARGEERLGLPALAGLFEENQCPDLDAAKLENRALLAASFRLAWLRENGGLARVNWRDMGPEELGSVYESLLELVPQISQNGRVFAFATGDETKGNARKTSGSYYTPDSLVQVLLDSALEPVVQNTIAAHPDKPAEALLQLSVVDPACGSGHFLLAAARHLAAHVARIQANGTPSAAEYRHALRQVVGHCIYGVDLNPMAVELCKVSLWMEAVEPGLPLTFLNSHIQHGNALLGTTPELMANGIPDAAWNPIEGDDKKVASALKKRNKAADAGQRGLDSLWSKPAQDESTEVIRAMVALDAAPDSDLAALAHKEQQWQDILASDTYQYQRFVADTWCAAFVWPKQSGVLADAAPTNELWRQIRDRQGQPPACTIKMTGDLVAQYNFFHWHLAFPQVSARGGFDVVLGNPPWERVKLEEQEFFASRSQEIASASKAAARKKLIAALPDRDPVLWSDWRAASRVAEGQSHLVRHSGRYPLCGKGDVNTYALFAEHNRSILRSTGRAGFVVPTGIATDDTTKDYFGLLVVEQKLVALFDFENRDGLFPQVARQLKFCLLTIGFTVVGADLVFFAYQVTELSNRERHFSLLPSDFATLNPNTRTCPTFRSRRDADLNLALYRRAGILWREGASDGNPWGLQFSRMLDMTNDSDLFRTRSQIEASNPRVSGNRFYGNDGPYLPLLEAKMVHHFDHRFGDYADRALDKEGTDTRSLPEVEVEQLANPTYVPSPRYWVLATEVEQRLGSLWRRDWLLGWRDITKSYNERTVVASVFPRVAVGNTTPLIFTSVEPRLIAALYANLCAFAFDYAARQKVGGTHLNYLQLKQLPALPPTAYDADTLWDQGTALSDFLLPRVLELTYAAWDLEPFAHDIGYDGPPFRWDPTRRFLLRAELDAAFFHLYDISHDDAAYILDTFPIVRKHDEKAHGEYRTKRVILEIYDAMTEATRTGKPYTTRLDPPPADPLCSHPPRVTD